MFWADAAGSTAEIKIYTLMGGLVWSKSVSVPSGGQIYDGLLRWNGDNNIGEEVLNGVYIAILNINGRTYKTKVAYIK